MKRSVFSIILLTVLLGLPFAVGSGAQLASSCSNSECSVFARLSPGALLISPVVLALCVFGRREVAALGIENSVGIWTRAGAFLIDFLVILTVLVPPIALGNLWIEASWTGKFSWSYSREFARWTDLFSAIGALGIFWVMFVYFSGLPKRNRATIGQYIMGYMIVPEGRSLDGMKTGSRAILGWLALVIWPLTILLACRRPDKVYWWDRASQTRAVKTYYV